MCGVREVVVVCGGAPPLHLPLSREGLLSLSLLRRFLPTVCTFLKLILKLFLC